jgi:hypothetical protein
MSHFTTIETQVRDIAALREACRDLGQIGTLEIHRATTIEFDNQTQYWRVRAPAGFPMFA